MLKELKNTRQIVGEPFRRWFTGNSIELIVWYDDQKTKITGFQLCYRNNQEQKAITWQQEHGYSHTTIDDGEGRTGRHKMAPILIPEGVLSLQSVLEQFMANSKNLDRDLVEFVSNRIKQYPKKTG